MVSNSRISGTAFVSAILLATLLYDQGYTSLALFLAGFAIWEAFIYPWWSDRENRQRLRREKDGVASDDWTKMKPGFARLWHRLRYGSAD